jgi:putative transposase
VKKIRFSAGIVRVLRQAEVGVPVAELTCQVGISEQTLYRWKKQYTAPETDLMGDVLHFMQKSSSRCRVAG